MSEPIITSELPTKTVVDWDFTYAGNIKSSLTVTDTETVWFFPDEIRFTHNDENGNASDERVVVRLQNMLYYSVKPRVVTIYPPGKSPLELAMAELAVHGKSS